MFLKQNTFLNLKGFLGDKIIRISSANLLMNDNGLGLPKGDRVVDIELGVEFLSEKYQLWIYVQSKHIIIICLFMSIDSGRGGGIAEGSQVGEEAGSNSGEEGSWSSEGTSYFEEEERDGIPIYIGEPDFYRYLREHRVSIKEEAMGVMSGRTQMYKLDWKFLPTSCVLFHRKGDYHQLIDCTLENQLVTISEGDRRRTQRRAIGSNSWQILEEVEVEHLPQADLLCTIQQLCFCCLSFEEFVDVFGKSMLEIERKEGRQSVRVDLQENERQSGSEEQNQDWLLGERKYQEGNQFEFERNIFEELAFQGTCIWPCLILQPLNKKVGALKERTNIHISQHQQLEFISQEQRQIIEKAFLDGKEGEKVGHQEQSSRNDIQMRKQIGNKIKSAVGNIADERAKLVGTKKVKGAARILNWNLLSQKQLKFLFQNTPFQLIRNQVSNLIEDLNNFKKREYEQSAEGSCLGKICSFRSDKPKQLSLALKNNPLVEHSILIRILREDEEIYKWVKQDSLLVNNTVPSFSCEEGLFNSVKCQLNVRETILNLQRRAVDAGRKGRQFMRKGQQEECCLICDKGLKDVLRSKNCRFCCGTMLLSKTKDNPGEWQVLEEDALGTDIYSMSKQCELCYIFDNFTKNECLVCERVVHWECAKQYQISFLAENKKFICQFCLSCASCKRTLVPSSSYKLRQKEITCLDCVKLRATKKNCMVCLGIEQPMLKCNKNRCEERIHVRCDFLFARKYQEGRVQNYHCPKCRKRTKRHLLRYLVDDLTRFDQCQYFTDPVYENLPYYTRIVKRPICFMDIRDNLASGKYDEDSFERIVADFTVLSQNAINFNMPNDNPYFRMRIVFMLGMKFLNQMRELVEGDDQLLVSGAEDRYRVKAENFYSDIKSNILKELVNFEGSNSRIEVTPRERTINEGDYNFNFRKYLLDQLGTSSILFRIKIGRTPIDNLLKTQQTKEAGCGPESQVACFFHPEVSTNLVHQCERCWQVFCCTKKCLRHHKCEQCLTEEGYCQSQTVCGCHKKEDEDILEEVRSRANKLGVSVLEATDMNRNCLFCALKHLQERLCYICHEFCYYSFSRCICRRYYHDKCQDKARSEAVQPGEGRAEQERRIGGCPECGKRGNKNVRLMRGINKNFKFKAFFAFYADRVEELLKTEGMYFQDRENLVQFFKNNYQQLKNLQHFLKLLDKKQDLNLWKETVQGTDTWNFPKVIETEALVLEDPLQRLNLLTMKDWFDQRNREKQSLFDETFLSEQILLKLTSNQKAEKYQRDVMVAERKYDEQNTFFQRNSIIEGHAQMQRQSVFSPESKQEEVQILEVRRMSKIKSQLSTLRQSLKKLYEKSKIKYIISGNIFIKRDHKEEWQCRKIFKGQPLIFKLRKSEERWFYQCKGVEIEVETIEEIIRLISEVNPYIQTLEQLIQFLGFNVKVRYKDRKVISRIFKDILSQDLHVSQRKRKVKNLYRNIQRKGYLPEQDKSSEPKEVFYLSKRKRNQKMQISDLISQNVSFNKVQFSLEEIKQELTNDFQKEESVDSFQEMLDQKCLYLAPSKIDRIGLFTKQDIPKSTMVIEYIGEIVSETVADKREEENDSWGCYMFGLDKKEGERSYAIDSIGKGNMARYINHSCKANCQAKCVEMGGKQKIVIYTVQDIERHEELTYDYKFKKEQNQYIECKCGSDNCQRRLN